eukprot:scaffold199681_cov16-Tisochrysis_lutea.AAC.1
MLLFPACPLVLACVPRNDKQHWAGNGHCRTSGVSRCAQQCCPAGVNQLLVAAYPLIVVESVILWQLSYRASEQVSNC